MNILSIAMLFLTQLAYTAVVSFITLWALSAIVPSLVVMSGGAWLGLMWVMSLKVGGSDEER